jgi:rubredoxin
MVIPFWMEYRSVTSGQAEPQRPPKRPELDIKRTFYCPLCGEEVAMPRWRSQITRPGASPRIFVRSLEELEWVVPQASAPVAQPRSQVHD